MRKLAGNSCSLTDRAQLSADIEQIKDDIEEISDLLGEVIAWASENTGCAERILFRLALQNDSCDEPKYLKACRELRSLDNDERKIGFWQTLKANNADLLKCTGLASRNIPMSLSTESPSALGPIAQRRLSQKEAVAALEKTLKIYRKRPWSCRALARKVGRSSGWVCEQEAYQEYYAKQAGGHSGAMPKVVSLTNSVLANAGDDDAELDKLIDEGIPEPARSRSQAINECDNELRARELKALIRSQAKEDEGSPLALPRKQQSRRRREL